MYWYPFNIADYKASTAHLSNEEDIAFRRLLDMYYDTELPIPLDTVWLSRRIRASIEAIESVLSDMFERREDGFHHKRCDAEIVKYQAFAESGKRGAAKRWGKKDSRSPKGSRLSIEILPEDWFNFCKAESPELDPERTFQQFRDYWIAVAGNKGLKTNWQSTWRNWVRTQKIPTGGNANGKFNAGKYIRDQLKMEFQLAEKVVGSGVAQEIGDGVSDKIPF